MLAFLWAEDQNGLIGQNGHLPWSLPNDLANFKHETVHEVVVMGRKTYDSLPVQPLPGRQNIVITRQPDLAVADGVFVMHTKAELLKYEQANPMKKIFIIGGADIFAMYADDVDYLYVTKIAESFEGNVYMPKLAIDQFELISQTPGVVDERNRYAHTFEIYQRR